MDLKWYKDRHEELQNQIWNLHADLKLITKHLGLDFKDIHERKVVKIGQA